MKVWERVFLYSVIAIMAFHLFLVDSKVESQGSVQEVIRAKRIEIVNDEGQPVVRLLDTGYLGGAVGVYYRDGTLIAKISSASVLKEGGAVSVYNQDGTHVADMRADEKGGAVTVSDKNGTPAVDMFVNETGGGGLRVNSKTGPGRPLVFMGNIEETGIIGIGNNIGNPLVGIMETPQGHGGIIFSDRDGKFLKGLP